MNITKSKTRPDHNTETKTDSAVYLSMIMIPYESVLGIGSNVITGALGLTAF